MKLLVELNVPNVNGTCDDPSIANRACLIKTEMAYSLNVLE